MAVAVSDSAALKIAASIDALTKVITAQNTVMNAYLVNNWSPAAFETPGTPNAILRGQAQAINDLAVLISETIAQQKKITAALTIMQSGLGSISANVAAGVTTSQLAVADQIKNNQFQQQTTNAALERAELPPTVVQPTDIAQSIENAVTDTLVIKSQVKASALVEEQITSAVAWTTTTVNNIVANSFIGTAATNAWGTLKGWLGIVDPPVVETQAEAKAAGRLKNLIDPKPIIKSPASGPTMSA